MATALIFFHWQFYRSSPLVDVQMASDNKTNNKNLQYVEGQEVQWAKLLLFIISRIKLIKLCRFYIKQTGKFYLQKYKVRLLQMIHFPGFFPSNTIPNELSIQILIFSSLIVFVFRCSICISFEHAIICIYSYNSPLRAGCYM